MRIGMTYDLKSDYLNEGFSLEQVAEFDCEETIDAIAEGIKAEGYEVDRIGNIKSLVKRLAVGDRWDLVFNIAEGVQGLGREAEVPALLEAYDIPYTFSGPDLMVLTLNKAMTDAVVRSFGVKTADFFLVKSEADIDKMPLSYPVFAKPVAEGTSKGITAKSCVHNKEELWDVCTELLYEFHQPVLIETYLSGREFTVGILGSGDNAHAIGVVEIVLGEKADQVAYTYENKQLYADRVSYQLVNMPEVAATALDAWKALDCQDAGRVDIRMNDEGIPCFIEVNPLAGLNPTYSDLPILCGMIGLDYNTLIKSILDSALERYRFKSMEKMRQSSSAA